MFSSLMLWRQPRIATLWPIGLGMTPAERHDFAACTTAFVSLTLFINDEALLEYSSDRLGCYSGTRTKILLHGYQRKNTASS